jgi:hypothetical protein
MGSGHELAQCAHLIMKCDRCQQFCLRTLFAKKRPRMLTASTRRPPIASTPMIVCTVSYRMALPAFLLPSVLVAACATMQPRAGQRSTASCLTQNMQWLSTFRHVTSNRVDCKHLCQDVAHLITGLSVAGSQHLQ